MERVESENLLRHGLLHYWLGEVRYAEGDLPGAIAEATTALLPQWGPFLSWFGFSSATLAHAHLDLGDADEARAVLERTAGRLDPGQLDAIALDLARARLMLRMHRPDEADRLVEHGADRLGELGHRDSPQIVWRPLACTVAAVLGAPDRARKLISEEIDLARETHAPGRLGVALRTAAGVTELPEDRLVLLRESVEVLETSERRLEHARALLDLGREQHALGDIAAARALLTEARDLAVRCGAGATADDALAALHATGARPRRAAQHGIDALTAAERRTVELAATGKTNREIGQELAVAPRTVEWHLSRAFAKLGVTSRRELPAALGVER
jgi:ATP/maltotriose-dependent transcriptional regulator MalT